MQFNISTQFCSILPIDRTLSRATTPEQSWPANDGNKGVQNILQSSGITGTSPSNRLVSYPEHTLRESYSSTEMQVGVFYRPSRLGNFSR